MGSALHPAHNQIIPMYKKGAGTYYVHGKLASLDDTEFMVDTGSGYITINEATLAQLTQHDSAKFVKNIVGILADGTRKVVPIWSVSSLNIGGNCHLVDVEAAVFPGRTRQILGLTALKKAAPFTLSFEPPELTLSRCNPVNT